MKNNYGSLTGLPVHRGLSAPNMGICEELHLVGGGCEFDSVCEDDNDKNCLLRKKLERSDNSDYNAIKTEQIQ